MLTNQGAVWTVDEIEFHRRRPQRSTDHRWKDLYDDDDDQNEDDDDDQNHDDADADDQNQKDYDDRPQRSTDHK